MHSSRVSTRHRLLLAAAALVLCTSLTAFVLLVALNPQTFWQQTDTLVYRDAGRFVWSDHGRLYSSTFSRWHLPFTYTPFAAAIFSLGRHVPFAGWQIVLAAGDLVCLVVSVACALKIAGTATHQFRRISLAIAMCLWLEPIDFTFHFGQINLFLLALIVVDLSGSSRGPWRGVWLGIAAGVKLTPLIFIPYLWLIGRRRAAYGALGFFGLTGGIGFALLPRDSASFWSGRLLRPGDGPTRLQDQSVHGFIQRLSPHGGAFLWVTLSIIVGIVGMTIAVRAARAGLQLTGAAACAATGLAISPLSWTHHYAYIVLVVVLVFSTELPARVRTVLGIATVALFAWWPWPNPGWTTLRFHTSGLLRLVPHGSGQETHWSVIETFFGNYYLWCVGLFLISVSRWTTTRRRERAAAVATAGPAATGSIGVPVRP